MTQDLESIFGELGLSQYLDTFIDQGFENWDTILDIQETDLDALGVKLGHRRKLQRRIANERGIAPSVSLASIKQALDDAKLGGHRRDGSRPEANGDNGGVTKRKYRRHPKPDEHAPERPPSAYVLFSNKMRDDVKDHSLTFTEIAKLVGENWQSLAPTERETYESQANAAKDKYRRELADYKRTPQYRKYAQYLHEFKEKQAKHSQGKLALHHPTTHRVHGHRAHRMKTAQDISKRHKLEPSRLRHGSSSSSVTHGGTMSSGTRSGSNSERLPESEAPTTRHKRVNSMASVAGSPLSSIDPASHSHRNSVEDSGMSPRSAHFDTTSPSESHHHESRRRSSWIERDLGRDQSQPNLPSLSNMLAGEARPAPEIRPSNTAMRSERRHALPDSLPTTTISNRPHIIATNISTAPMNGATTIQRSNADGALSIHALLSTKDMEPAQGRVIDGNQHYRGPTGYGFQNESSAFGRMRAEQSGDGDIVMTAAEDHHHQPNSNGKPKGALDGMNALLRAGEIVGHNASR